MAIIYTYPVKTDPVAADKVLISDSEDDNKTKSVTIEDIRSGTVSGVSSILAGNNVTISPAGGTGDVTVNATAYTAGDGIDITSYVIGADIKANSGITIDGTELSLDLSASAIEGTLAVGDGGTGANTFTAGFLVANGTSAFTTQSQIDLTSQVADTLSIANGGTGEITRQEAINSLTNVSGASSGNVLTYDGTNASFSQFNLSNAAGTLAVGSGGTGASTFTAGFLKANGTSAFTTAANIDLTADVTNTLAVSNGGTGLNTIAAGFVTRGNGTSAVVADSLEAVLDQISKEQMILLKEYSQKLTPMVMFYMLFGIIVPSIGVVLAVALMSVLTGESQYPSIVLLPVFLLIVLMQFLFLGVIESSRPKYLI